MSLGPTVPYPVLPFSDSPPSASSAAAIACHCLLFRAAPLFRRRRRSLPLSSPPRRPLLSLRRRALILSRRPLILFHRRRLHAVGPPSPCSSDPTLTRSPQLPRRRLATFPVSSPSSSSTRRSLPGDAATPTVLPRLSTEPTLPRRRLASFPISSPSSSSTRRRLSADATMPIRILRVPMEVAPARLSSLHREHALVAVSSPRSSARRRSVLACTARPRWVPGRWGDEGCSPQPSDFGRCTALPCYVYGGSAAGALSGGQVRKWRLCPLHCHCGSLYQSCRCHLPYRGVAHATSLAAAHPARVACGHHRNRSGFDELGNLLGRPARVTGAP